MKNNKILKKIPFLITGIFSFAAVSTILTGVLAKDVVSENPFTLTANKKMAYSSYSTSNGYDGTSGEEIKASDFADAKELNRDVLYCDIKSSNKTSVSRTITLSFTCVRTTGYGNSDKSVYLVIDDDNFTGDLLDPVFDRSGFNGRTPEVNAYVGNIGDVKKAETLIIPETYTYGNTCVIKNTTIPEGVFSFPAVFNEQNPSYIKNIVIPAGITNLESGAFKNVPSYVNIFLECNQAELPATWNLDFVDNGTIYYLDSVLPEGVTFPEIPNKKRTQTTGTYTIYLDDGNPFILGYIYDKESTAEDKRPIMNRPLVVSYDIKCNGATNTVFKALPVETTNGACYEGVGKIGNYTINKSLPVVLEDGESLDYDSVKIYNIYSATKKEETVYDPKTSGNKTVSYNVPDISGDNYYVKATKRFNEEIDINQIVICGDSKIATFGGYTLVSMNLDKPAVSYYNTAMQSALKLYADKIESGEYSLRYTVYSINNSEYQIQYKAKDGSIKESKVFPNCPNNNDYFVLNSQKGNKLSFVIKNSDIGNDFKANKLTYFELIGFTVNIHLWNNDTNQKVSQSDLNVKFGALEIMDRELNKINVSNLNILSLGIFFAYTIIYIAGACILFAVLKAKFKNDEFRRINPKKYFKKAIIGLAGSLVVTCTIVSVSYRFGLFYNSVSGHNPTDLFLVLSGLISIVLIGYFVKFVIALVQAEKKRREIVKLRLNEDVADDGTK